MAVLAKNRKKARYLVRSVMDGRKMQELCDNKDQVRRYLARIKPENREDVVTWARLDPKALVRKH